MLNDTVVLNYIKNNLAFPFMMLEWNDDQILSHVKEQTIREFSYYVPDVKNVPLNVQLESNKVPGRANEFYIQEPDGREILSVKNIYFDMSNFVALGHPPVGVFGHFELRNWALQVATSMETKMFSSFDKTFEFKHPNIVRISPVNVDECKFVTVEYERMQSKDFSEVPNDLHMYFLKMSLADVMIALGRIRKRYAGMKTPFGEIPIDAEVLDEGKELKREVLDVLERTFVPNVRVDFG